MTITLDTPSASAAACGEYPASLAELAELIEPLFARREPFLTAVRYIASLLAADLPANSWQRARATGETSPWRMQRLLNRASWDEAAVRDAVASFTGSAIGHPGAVVAIRENSVAKKGRESVAVARQYASAAGKVENCQVTVTASYISPKGHTIVDHALYLPRSWADNPDRCRKAGVPEKRMVHFTKTELATHIIGRLKYLGLPIGWVYADQVFGNDEVLRAVLGSAGLSYVLKIAPNHPAVGRAGLSLADLVNRSNDPMETWGRFSPAPVRSSPGESVFVRCRSGERYPSFYLARSSEAAVSDIARVIATCDSSERSFSAARQARGLDRYEVRTWTAWHRHVTLAMAALSTRVAEISKARGDRTGSTKVGAHLTEAVAVGSIPMLHGSQKGNS